MVLELGPIKRRSHCSKIWIILGLFECLFEKKTTVLPAVVESGLVEVAPSLAFQCRALLLFIGVVFAQPRLGSDDCKYFGVQGLECNGSIDTFMVVGLE